jgi:hypothetical protein
MAVFPLHPLVSQAYATLFQQPDGMVPPLMRQQLYLHLPNLFYNWPTVRATIDYLALRKILPLLDPFPHLLVHYHVVPLMAQIKAAVNHIGGTHTARDRAEALAVRVLHEIDTGRPDGETLAMPQGMAETNPDYVLFALLETLYSVGGVYRFDTVVLTPDATNRLDIWSCDTALWACLAWADDPVTYPERIERRRNFWSWWLSEALPRAWERGSTR